MTCYFSENASNEEGEKEDDGIYVFKILKKSYGETSLSFCPKMHSKYLDKQSNSHI